MRSKAVTVDGKPAMLHKRGTTWLLRWDGGVASKTAGNGKLEDLPDVYELPLDGWKVVRR